MFQRIVRAVSAATLMTVMAITPLFAASDAQSESFTLDNGLEVIVIPNHRIPAVSQMLWFRIGAADDPAGKSGLAHFHEHVMFLGTAKHKSGEYTEIISRHGGENNAFTGHDATSYYINIAKENLPLAMELEADRLGDMKATDEAVKNEKQVIIEERRMRVENNPDALLSEQVSAALFRNHPYHWPVIGWMHEMDGLTKDDIIRFHKTWYHPNNALLILSGDITAAEAKPLVKKYYGHLKKVAVPPRQWNDEPPQNAARRITLHHKNVKRPSWSRTYAVPSFAYGKKELALPLFVLSEALGEGKACRLYKALVMEQKLATAVSVDYGGFSAGPALFDITITPEQGIDLAVLEKAVDTELEKAIAEGFSESELTRAKTLLKAETIYARDSLTAMARIMGWIRMSGLDKDYFTRWPSLIEAVTPQQVNDAAREVLKPTASVTALLLPEDTATAKAAGAKP